jgi:HEAT repeat protein
MSHTMDPSNPASPAAGAFVVVESFLDDLVASYESNPHRTRVALRELLTKQPDEFVRSSLRLFDAGMGAGAADAIARLLIANDMAVPAISNPAVSTLHEAVHAARACAVVEPALDVQLMKRVAATHGAAANPVVVMRVLELLAIISDGYRVMAPLMQLLREPNLRIRSKVVFLIGRTKKEVRWLDPYLRDADYRIRANAVEALWGESTADAVQVFRNAIKDAHHRVAANGCVGLHQAGDPEAVDQIEQMASFASPLHQSAACWAMGKCPDPAFLPSLQEFVKSKDAVVRRSAMRANVLVRRLLQEKSSSPV